MRRYSRGGTILVVALVLTPFFANADLPQPTCAEGEGVMSTDKSFYCLGEHVNITATGWAIVSSVGDFPDIFWAITNASGDPVFETFNPFDLVAEFNGTLNGTWNQTYRLMGGQPPSGEQVPPGRYTVWFYEIPRPNETIPDWIPVEIRIVACGGGPVADAGPDQTVYEGEVVQFNGSASQGVGNAVFPIGPNMKVNDGNDTGGVAGSPHIALDDNGTAFVVWPIARVGGCDVYFDKAPRQGQFGKDVRVDDTPPPDGTGGHSDIAIGPDGEIHVVWWVPGIRYSSSTDGGVTFSPSIAIDDVNHPAGYPVRVDTGTDGSVHAVWRAVDLSGVYFRSSPDGGTSWDSVFRVSDGAFPDVAAVDNSSAYVVWAGKVMGSNETGIFFSRKGPNGSFEPPIRVHPLADRHRRDPSIALLPSGEIFVTWVEYGADDNTIALVRSLDGGSSFEPPIIVRYVKPQNYPHIVRLDRPAVTGFGSEGVAVAWAEYIQPFDPRTDIRVSVSLDKGSTLGPYYRVDDDPKGAGKRHVAIAGNADGDLFAAWHDARDTLSGSLSGSIAYGVWLDVSADPSSLTYEWDFDANVDSDGDGNYTNDVDATGPTPTHVYYDDGIYVVTLKVTDASGLSDWDICNITVLNVPPTPEWTSRSSDGTILNPPYPEGKEILFEATVYDPGIYDTFTYDWDFGDGTILLDAGPSVTHTYGDDDIYIVVLTVTDDDGGVGIDDTPPLDTTNENPVASIDMPFCIFTEGTSPCEAIGQFTDPGWLDTHSAVWDYGDGTYETAVLTEENDSPDATGMNITSHIYGDNGVYNITFTVVDDDGGVGIAWAEAQVINLPPSVDMNAPSSVNEGEDFVLGITATDPGSDDIIISIDWGDGTADTETFYNNGIGPDPPNSGQGVWPFTVYLNTTHVYGDNGNFTIQVTVEDDDGGSVQDSAAIEVLNLPPEIVLPMIPMYFDEGEEFTLAAKVTDPGSDDVEFIWTLELGPSLSSMYYNDGVGPDPPLSPWGTFPFVVEDTVNHTYGDNGYYNVTITVTDDDGGVSTSVFTIEIRNVEPSIDIGGPYAGDENSPIEFTATVTDPGSDDLTFVWDWGDGTTDAIAFYNDGINVDPPKSPWGTYPFSATHTTTHLWGDNGDFTVTLTVMDDDGGITVEQTVVTVNNVAPTIESIRYYLNASFSFRIAGEKWHNVEIHLYEDGTEIGYANITRYPGSPNEQMVTLADISIDFSKTYSAIAYYTPEDDPVNGQIWGATPAWVILEYEDGEERIHHTFNVRHEDTWMWTIDDFSPYFLGHNITFMATASDPGSDDLTFTWNWGDGNTTENVYYNDGVGPDPYPSPEVNPISVTDTVRHGYALAGTYMITLTVTDDDGGSETITLALML